MQLIPLQISSSNSPDDDAATTASGRADARRARRSRRSRRIRRFALAAAVLLVILIIAPRVTTWAIARGDIAHAPTDLPRLTAGEQRAAIVLGAGLVGDRPSPALRDRIDAAVELLESGRVDLLLMSGDNTTQYYDEPTVMRRYALEQGAAPQLVAVDYAGRRTWDTCVRAAEVFGIESAVVVTNAFHVDRALVACRAAGIETLGYSASEANRSVTDRAGWRVRELAATWRALLDAWVLRPEPAVGGEQIDPYDPCQLYASLAPSVAAAAADDFARFGC